MTATVFSPQCRESRPTLYIVKSFVRNGGTEIVFSKKGRPSSKSDVKPEPKIAHSLSYLPKEVLDVFKKTITRNMELILFRTANTPKDKGTPLFIQREVEVIEDLPKQLGPGDIIVCFTSFPSEYLFVETIREFVSQAQGRDLAREYDAVFNRYWHFFLGRWDALSAPGSSKPQLGSVQPPGDPEGIGGGAVLPLRLSLKRGSTEQTYFACRVALVEFARAVDDAINVQPNPKRCAEFRKKLVSTPEENDRFGPHAVAALLRTLVGDEKQKLLECIGRALAYTALHEVWHAALLRGDHPEIEKRKEAIEAEPSPSRPNLVFRPETIGQLNEKYQETWCKIVRDRRRDIVDIQ